MPLATAVYQVVQWPNSKIPDWGIKTTPAWGRTGTPGYIAGGPVRQPMPELTLSPSQGSFEYGYKTTTRAEPIRTGEKKLI